MNYIRQTYRIYPTKEQAAFLAQELGNQRFLWNLMLGENKKLYEEDKKFLFFSHTSKILAFAKLEYNFLTIGNSQPLQQTLRDLDQALRQSFQSNKGFPKFKKKGHTGSVRYPQGVKIEGDKLKLPKQQPIKIVNNGQGLPENFNSITILKKPSGKWFASFVVPYELSAKVELTEDSKAVGLDLNSKRFVVTSDGEYVTNPKHIKEKEKRLKRYQRKYSRCQKGSTNKHKARYKLAKLHEKVANQRKDFVEKLTTQIAKAYDVISIEDLNVKGMQKFNGRMIQSAPFALFRSKLTWKANKYGKHLVVIDRYDPTSKMCNSCGTLHDMPLKARVMSCSCGNVMDRDLNAAKNILTFGLTKLELGQELSEVTPLEILRLQNSKDLTVRWESLKEETPSFRLG